MYKPRPNNGEAEKKGYSYTKGFNTKIPLVLSPSLNLVQAFDSQPVSPIPENNQFDGERRLSDYDIPQNSRLRNYENELREARLKIHKLTERHEAEIQKIIGNKESADLIIALNAEVEAAKKAAMGFETENRILRLKIARMEQADAKKAFDFDVWNTIAMKGGQVQNQELTNLTKTVMQLRSMVAKLTKEVEDRDIKLQEARMVKRQAQTNDGYQMLTIAELRDSLELKNGLVTELRTIKAEYHQQIQDMRKRIGILESDGSGRGRIGNNTVIVDQGGLATLRAKNDVLENMLEGFMRTLEIVRRSGGMDMTVGGVYQRTKTSLEFCSHLAQEKSQLEDMVGKFEKEAEKIRPMLLKLRDKKVKCKEVKEYAARLLNTSQDFIDLLEVKVKEVNNLPLINNIRAQLYDMHAPLRMVLVTLRHFNPNEYIDYDLAIDSEELYQLKSEMKMLRLKLSTLETENTGLKAEISLLESTDMSTDSVAYRLALLRQQYKDQIVDLESTLEEVLSQAQDELGQAFLDVRQLQEPRNLDWLDSIISLTDKLHAKMQGDEEKLRNTEASCEKRILELMERYEKRLSELEIENQELKEEVDSLNSEMNFVKKHAGNVSDKPAKMVEEGADKEAIERIRGKLRDAQTELSKVKHKQILENEETQQKNNALLREIKMWNDRCENRDSLIAQLREGLKRQEAEMAQDGRMMGKMAEKLIDKLQKRLAEQQRKLEQLGTSSDLMSDGEKRQLDTEIAALHKDLRIKEVELEELSAESKFTIERLQKEINRLTDEKNTYSGICAKLRGDLKEKSKTNEAGDKNGVLSPKRRSQVQTLNIKLLGADDTIKTLRKNIVTLTLEHEGEVDDLVKRLKTQKDNHEKSMKQLRHKYETQIGDLIKNYEDRILKIRKSYEERKKNFNVGGIPREQRLGMLRDKHDTYIKTLKADHKARIRSILAKFEKQLNERDNIIARIDLSLLSSLSRFNETAVECDELESAHQKALTVLWNQITQIEEFLAQERAKRVENDRKTRELQASISNLYKLFEASESRLDNNIALLEEQNEAMKAEHKVDLVALEKEMEADRKKKSDALRIRWPRRRNVSLILSLRHDNYLNIWQ